MSTDGQRAPRARPTSERESSHHGPLFWAGVVVGGAMMSWALVAAFVDMGRETATTWLVWWVGLDLVNDLLVLPMTVGVGWLVLRFVPRRARGPVQAGLFATAVALALAYAPATSTAIRTGNPTIQPLNYATATLTVVAVIWTVVLTWLAWRALTDDAED